VIAFRRKSDGTVSARLAAEEAVMLTELAGQLIGMLSDRSPGGAPSDDGEAPDEDPALLRLLPDAYPDDREASSEFRRFTADGLAERKTANANAVIESLADVAAGRTKTLRLDQPVAQAWLRSLTDLRLTIAARLGIETDEDHPESGDPLGDIYDWLGFVQGTLVEALDRP
jgi:Domain of unknown function (DUF2017)